MTVRPPIATSKDAGMKVLIYVNTCTGEHWSIRPVNDENREIASWCVATDDDHDEYAVHARRMEVKQTIKDICQKKGWVLDESATVWS